MPTPDEAAVKAVLQKNDRDIRCRDAIEQAWSYCQALPDRGWWRRKSTTAAIMWEHSIANVVEALDGDAGAKVIAHQDTTSFIFDDTVLLRFKRAGLSLMSSNYPTQLANLFHAHTRDLFGFDGHHRVEIVHVFNRFQTALDWIGVVARDKKELLWQFELRRGGAAVIALPPSERPMPAAETVLRPAKPGDERRDAEEK
ncbi:hypothetical protein O4H52_19350 [Sphingomonadaceae bacterium G21617-S1]|nr:hypothetical protein [Sphingomonadaceae bacterium G21617-S1]